MKDCKIRTSYNQSATLLMMFFLNTYGNLIPESQNNPGNLKKKKKKSQNITNIITLFPQYGSVIPLNMFEHFVTLNHSTLLLLC